MSGYRKICSSHVHDLHSLIGHKRLIGNGILVGNGNTPQSLNSP
jgi:hypothetical protein